MKEEDTEDMEEDPATPKAGAEASTDVAAANKASAQACLPSAPAPWPLLCLHDVVGCRATRCIPHN